MKQYPYARKLQDIKYAMILDASALSISALWWCLYFSSTSGEWVNEKENIDFAIFFWLGTIYQLMAVCYIIRLAFVLPVMISIGDTIRVDTSECMQSSFINKQYFGIVLYFDMTIALITIHACIVVICVHLVALSYTLCTLFVLLLGQFFIVLGWLSLPMHKELRQSLILPQLHTFKSDIEMQLISSMSKTLRLLDLITYAILLTSTVLFPTMIYLLLE